MVWLKNPAKPRFWQEKQRLFLLKEGLCLYPWRVYRAGFGDALAARERPPKLP